MERRQLIKSLAVGGTFTAMWDSCKESTAMIDPKHDAVGFGHSVCRWCYQNIPFEEFADRCKDMGIQSIELLTSDEWDVVLDRGMTCAIGYGSTLGLTKGFSQLKYHKQLQEEITATLPLAADKGITQIITFSGNRENISDDEGLENCAVGLEPLVKAAEKMGITLVMELLNSRIDHHDYQCDRTEWGVRLVEKLGSPHFKLLYDIYHMQIMEGDVIRTIRDNIQYISHFHTGGVPGRNEIDNTQELYYPAIMKAINDIGFTGFVAQEFIPKSSEPLISLQQGVEICSSI